MKTAFVAEFGGPDALVITEIDHIPPAANEVTIAVEAAGVGFVDVLVRSGRYPGATKAGLTPGMEVAGTIIDAGASVPRACIGQRVFSMVPIGGYAEQVNADQAGLVPLPAGLSSSAAVALGINAAVAEIACQRAGVAPGTNLLVRGAGGGIGVLAVQIAKRLGAHVTAITSSAERGERLRSLGASAIIDRTTSAQESGDSYDIVIDPVGGPDLSTYLGKLRPNGQYILCGIVGGLPAPEFGMHLLKNFQKSVSISTFSLNSIDPRDLLDSLWKVFVDAASGLLNPIEAGVFPLADAAQAHRALESGSVFGKLVLKP